ncbi:C-methyl transferase, partial [Lentithecium fluviatile CBS 122367]
VGAGTGSMTSHILSAFQEREERTGGIAISEYVYTDISPAFFENAKDKFYNFRDRMSFKTLDLELDITAQGFEAGSYDVVFAGSVLHATKNLVATLHNIRRVLKPGGQI